MNCATQPFRVQRFNGFDFKVFQTNEILKSVCKVSKIQRLHLLGASHEREIVEYRYITMYFLRKHTGLTLKKISYILNRHYSTVIYGLQIHDELMESTADYRAKFEAVKRELQREEVDA